MPLLLSNPCPKVDLCHALCLHIGGKVKRCIIEVLRREMGAAQTKSWGQEVFDLECWDAVVLLQGKDCLRNVLFCDTVGAPARTKYCKLTLCIKTYIIIKVSYLGIAINF